MNFSVIKLTILSLFLTVLNHWEFIKTSPDPNFKQYVKMGKIFGDNTIATAMLDRIVSHSTTLNVKRDSYRLREKANAGREFRPLLTILINYTLHITN